MLAFDLTSGFLSFDAGGKLGFPFGFLLGAFFNFALSKLFHILSEVNGHITSVFLGSTFGLKVYAVFLKLLTASHFFFPLSFQLFSELLRVRSFRRLLRSGTFIYRILSYIHS